MPTGACHTAHLPIYEAEQVAAGVMQGHRAMQDLAARGDGREYDDAYEEDEDS